MNTFTFTDDEVEWLIYAIEMHDGEGREHMQTALDKLNNPKQSEAKFVFLGKKIIPKEK